MWNEMETHLKQIPNIKSFKINQKRILRSKFEEPVQTAFLILQKVVRPSLNPSLTYITPFHLILPPIVY